MNQDTGLRGVPPGGMVEAVREGRVAMPNGSRTIAAVLATVLAAACTGGGGGAPSGMSVPPAPVEHVEAEIEVPEQPPGIAASRNAAEKDAIAAIRNVLKKGAIDMWQRQRADDRIRIKVRHTLHGAAASGDLSAVRKLLAAGADPNARDEVPFPAGDVPIAADHLPGTTPLQEAVRWGGGLDVVQALIAAGADPNARNGGGLALLHSAMFRNSPAVVEALIAAGADPSARDEDNFARFRAAICRRYYARAVPGVFTSSDIIGGPGSMILEAGLAVLGSVNLSSSSAIVDSDGGIVVGTGAASFEGLTLIGPAFIDLDAHC